MRTTLVWCAASLFAIGQQQEPVAPAVAAAVAAVDHHLHLFTTALGPVSEGLPLTAAALVDQLDEAGIRRAAVFSVAYGFGNPNRPAVEHEYQQGQSRERSRR